MQIFLLLPHHLAFNHRFLTGDSMKTYLKAILLSLIVLTLAGCGSDKTFPEGLTANHSGNGFTAHMEHVSFNTYKFTIVSNDNHRGAIFSVYGLADESYVSTFNPNTRVRLAHVSDGHQAGSTFEVTFNNDDNFFIIYQDALVGGSFVFDTTKEMLRGTFRQ